MNTSTLRKLLILATLIGILALLSLIFYLSNLIFEFYDHVRHISPIFWAIFVVLLVGVLIVGGKLMWSLWTVGRSGKKSPPKEKIITPPSAEELQQRVAVMREKGADVTTVEAEMAAIQVVPQELEVAFFGKISTGKSSLIKTLVPHAHVEISIIGGSTSQIERYYYDNAHGLRLTLLDMPGTEQAGTEANVDDVYLNAVRRVHLIVYVVDQDLTASDKKALEKLIAYQKPFLVALNKINLYTPDERAELRAHIVARLPPKIELVEVASAYQRRVQRVLPNGQTTWELRPVAGEVAPLIAAFQRHAKQKDKLTEHNQQSLLHLAHEKLQAVEVEHRQQKGERLVYLYSRKAMLGGVAAVGPGSDIVIQGYLAINMMKEITALYGISAKEVDLQSVVNAASGKLKSNRTIALMLAGNICKAFPGLGTVVGGVSHAVAYGLIFQSLGRATLQALEESDEYGFSAQVIIQDFEQQLNTNLEQRAKSLLTIALKEKKT